MDDVAVRVPQSLYEDDFYAWTQAQTELLRSGRLDEADIANILEEIESLGRTQVAELRSRVGHGRCLLARPSRRRSE